MVTEELSGEAEPARDPNAPLFSLPQDEGAGAMIAAAAGDVAGGAAPTWYSLPTQMATVVAYHVMQFDGVERDILQQEMMRLTGSEGGIDTIRGGSEEFTAWAASVKEGSPAVSSAPSVDPAARVAPIGVWFRRRPEDLVAAAIGSARVTHMDAASVTASVAVAGAVAGSCFYQVGRDLVAGIIEICERALAVVEEEAYRYSDVPGGRAFVERLRTHVGSTFEEPADTVARVTGGEPLAGIDGAVLGIMLGAGKVDDPIRLIEAGAMTGGSHVGSIVGAIVGARTGVVRWPWRVPNDTWFAEIGVRLATGVSEVRDLPIPYAVEERMAMSPDSVASQEEL